MNTQAYNVKIIDQLVSSKKNMYELRNIINLLNVSL